MMKKVLIAFFTLLLLGCVTPYTHYTDEFSEMHLSMDGSKAMFIGKSKYVYIFDAPDYLNKAIVLPFVKKMSIYATNSYIEKNGDLKVNFSLYFKTGKLSQGEIDQLMKDGFVRSVYNRGGFLSPEHLEVNCNDCRKLVPNDDRLLLVKKLSMTGKRYLKSGNESLENYDSSKLPHKSVVRFTDLQNKSIDLFAPSALVLGAASCLAVAPLCFAVSAPMMGMRP